MLLRKSDGRGIRQPGQVRKEAAVTISSRVVPASTVSLHNSFDMTLGSG